MPAGWTRITKQEWQVLGGLRSPEVMRNADSRGRWRYYRRTHV